jgi:hypothetical protein
MKSTYMYKKWNLYTLYTEIYNLSVPFEAKRTNFLKLLSLTELSILTSLC